MIEIRKTEIAELGILIELFEQGKHEAVDRRLSQ